VAANARVFVKEIRELYSYVNQSNKVITVVNISLFS
jgi:hypothetical protein